MSPALARSRPAVAPGRRLVMARLAILGTLLASLLTSPVAAQSALAWKFAQGDVFFVQRDIHNDQALTVKEKVLKAETQATWVFRFEVQTAPADPVKDAAVLVAKIHSVKFQHVVGPTSIESKWLTRMKGATFTLDVSRRGRVVKLAGYDDFAALVAEKKDDVVAVVRQIWPEALLKQEFDDMLAVAPDQPVAVGERWTESGTMVLPPLGSFTTETRKAFGEIDRAGHIHMAGTIAGKYSPPTAPADFFRVAGGDLKMTKGTWESTFDRERGRMLRVEKKIELSGRLVVEMAGASLDAELVLKNETTSKLLPREP
jgi:Family of unknown function (DUF6263)